MKFIKKIVVCMLLLCCAFTFTACNKDDKIKIGILQSATHSALDAAREGFMKALEDAGYDDTKVTYDFENPEGNPANMQLMAKTLVRKCDIVLGIATDAAVALKVAAETEGTNIPVLFTAVTDAVDASLVESNEHPNGRVTGTSDINPVADQIALAKQLKQDLKKVGILYTISETNSKVQADMAIEEIEKEGLEYLERTVTGVTDIQQTLKKLISDGAEIIYIPTDNNLAKNMVSVCNIANESKIPVICGKENMVKAGGLITFGVNYTKLGEMVGAMAVQIIEGADPKDLPVGRLSQDECNLVINTSTVSILGIEIPSEIMEKATKVTTE